MNSGGTLPEALGGASSGGAGADTGGAEGTGELCGPQPEATALGYRFESEASLDGWGVRVLDSYSSDAVEIKKSEECDAMALSIDWGASDQSKTFEAYVGIDSPHDLSGKRMSLTVRALDAGVVTTASQPPLNFYLYLYLPGVVGGFGGWIDGDVDDTDWHTFVLDVPKSDSAFDEEMSNVIHVRVQIGLTDPAELLGTSQIEIGSVTWTDTPLKKYLLRRPSHLPLRPQNRVLVVHINGALLLQKHADSAA